MAIILYIIKKKVSLGHRKERDCCQLYLAYVWEACFTRFLAEAFFPVGPVHYLWNPQVLYSTTFYLKLGPTALFTHLKIILLHCF